ncbi:hypothetical protein SARC_08804 [Sphaeroforma arctica JP610]|uniref:RRM domain-containing protein n=1 Tax=Sphaeroforma arctica JP610 TaxID=667725 RepID=A0A0L0FQF3_9EUKA|nr:hypothetical protein SARC_08804 [Sphaeroforma arctica JP610]KNC78776.1 hypothetical protein SARC_08804 [Sphaeroforma arctica JP610]|eukprot:XP_014152678.1 hypothetical protein SARC_08804 [Sphaeroforma arctica JP610]
MMNRTIVMIPPSPTVYIQGLNEKTKKQELRRTLYSLFSQHGPILDVVALKTKKLRGQAWVVFRDTASAIRAVSQLNGFTLYDRQIRLNYSRNKSNAVAIMDGTFGKKTTKKAGYTIKSDKNLADKEKAQAKPKNPASGNPTSTSTPAIDVDENPPYRILLVLNLPEETTDEMLRYLFGQFPGLKDVRMIPNRTDVSFVEFEDDVMAAAAKTGLQGFLIKPDHPGLVLTFAKQA